MTDFTDKFSDGRVPPSDDSYASLVITTDTSVCWPSNYDGTVPALPEILDITCGAGNVLTLPPVDQVSTGRSVLIRNIGGSSLLIRDSNNVVLLTLAAGVAQYLWVTNNVQPGAWGQVTYGAGSSSVSAGALAGYGTKATGATLSVAAPTFATSGSFTLTTANRGQAVEFTTGAATLSLAASAGYGGDFYCFVKNAGAGLITISPIGGEFIDGQATLGLQPSESLILMCNGVGNWYSVGYGRSILYQFSQLVLDVSAGGTFTLNSAQASNKMLTFVGNPAAPVEVVVPPTVGVYYVANNLSTTPVVQVKTDATPGPNIGQTQRSVLLCDGTSVTAAQSASVSTALSMLDGSVSAPSLNYASKTNTGFYKYSTQGLGLSVNGAAQLTSNGTGVDFPNGLSALSPVFTGVSTFPAGAVATPSVVPTGDPNTGLWFPAADTVAISTGGSERIRIAADGNATMPGTLAMGSAFGFRNKIINGDMRAHQRTGTIHVGGSATYTLDRWVCLAAGANINVSQASYGAGYRFSNALVIGGAVGNTLAQVQQRIEGKNISGCVGKTFTVSAEIYSTDATTVNWVARYANTVDNFGAVTIIASGSVSVPAASYANRSFSFTVPGGYANTGIEVVFYVNGLLAGKQLGFANIQLEEGSVATPFENRLYGLELALCQRYYEVIEGGITAIGSTPIGVTLPYTVAKRSTPTVLRIGAGNAGYAIPTTAIATPYGLNIANSSGGNVGGIFSLTSEL